MNEQNNHAALTIAQQYPPAQYNLLVPMQTVTEIADIQKPVMNSVSISTNLNDGEIYEMEKAKDEWRDSKGYVHKATPAKYALTKKGLTKLMRAAGIKILSSRPVVPSTCQKCAEVNRSIGKPIRCGGCPNKDVKHEVRISVPQLTGENVTIVAHKEIAVDDVTAGMTEKQRAEFMKFRSEMCESKALNRALRTAMQIKSSYLIEEFKKPFVVAYLVPNLDNPAVREEAVKSMFGAANDLYGSRPKTSHTVYVDDDDEGYAQPEPDFEVVPEQPKKENPAAEPSKKQNKKANIIAIAVAVFFAFMLFGGFDLIAPRKRTTSTTRVSTPETNRSVLEETALNALDKESAAYISSIDAFYYSGKYTLTVRTVSSGGLYLPIVAEQTAQAVFDKAAELGITLSEYKVEEFSEGNSSKVENMILWKSADGVTGTYTDDTGSSPYIETDVTVERLAEIVK